ncbi:3-mercaptopyruvate sulfurtransferase [Emcibacter nanhaiensis]|uniref:3-mercaptopyruvate sulfurtransferase n=1 Tax=Emcibacter nanhaiensis TaxID=1505037 RepID=A0A501PQZ9_9PROT|nr:3-mercaptopyruvate sulfurtransferase [Emcibacter nanhaiensis]TPD62675.1 3-mercaptopyruvate sulfurtransferase [Emcibacter nanhaiensis]
MIDEKNALVSTDWLLQHLEAPDVRVVDASWHLPWAERDGKAEYEESHIPGAVFFDQEEICDTDSHLPHMLPSPEKMSSRMRKLGLGDGMRIVVYDNSDIRSAARVWFMLKAFGHRDVAVLDGGFQKWRAEGKPTEDIPPVPGPRHFTARFNATLVRELDQMMENLNSKREQVVDARSAARFNAESEEPRPGMKSGHIPGSLNLPYERLFNENGTYKSPEEMEQVFADAGVDLSQPIVTTCGSGGTAAVLCLALSMIGNHQYALYDGSWSEWGSHPDTPVHPA